MRAQKKFNIVVRFRRWIPTFSQKSEDNETWQGSGEPVARGVSYIAKGYLEQELLPIQNRSWSVVPSSRDDLPPDAQSGFSKKYSLVDQTQRKTWSSIIMKKTSGCSRRQPERDQRIDTVSDSWKAHQSNKERFEVCCKGRIEDGQQLYQRIYTNFHREEPMFIESSTRSLQQESEYIDALSQKDWGYASLLYHTGFSQDTKIP